MSLAWLHSIQSEEIYFYSPLKGCLTIPRVSIWDFVVVMDSFLCSVCLFCFYTETIDDMNTPASFNTEWFLLQPYDKYTYPSIPMLQINYPTDFSLNSQRAWPDGHWRIVPSAASQGLLCEEMLRSMHSVARRPHWKVELVNLPWDFSIVGRGSSDWKIWHAKFFTWQRKLGIRRKSVYPPLLSRIAVHPWCEWRSTQLSEASSAVWSGTAQSKIS